MAEDNTGVTLKIWRQFNALLEEAVVKGSYAGVEMLLQHEAVIRNGSTKTLNSNIKQRCVLLAAENGNVQILKLFVKYYTIPFPHITNCHCDECQKDKYGQLRHRLTLLKALSNPMWIFLTSEDPFLTLFRIYKMNKTFCIEDDCFEKEYASLADENEKLCLKLLYEVKSEEEGVALMQHKAPVSNEDNACNLSFIKLAVAYRLKEVTAHPVTQHFLTSTVFDDIPKWRASGIGYKLFFVTFMFISYPITSLLNKFIPKGYCLPIVNIANTPFVKFINGIASYVTFLALLISYAVNKKSGLRVHKAPSRVEIAILVWLFGLCVGEYKQVQKRGVSQYLSNGWNWIDIGMDALMLYSFITWLVLYHHTPQNDNLSDRVRFLADGTFALAMVLAFFRIIYVCQITRYLGLLQLSLGGMVMVIFQFIFICIIVLLAFTIAMSFLFNASGSHDKVIESYDIVNANKSSIYRVLTETFNGFWATLHTMSCAAIKSSSDYTTINNFADGSFTHLFASIGFIAYLGMTIVILLNMLIAMMNSSYQRISDNLTTEHKFARTTLWMEYIGDEHSNSIPLNLIPSAKLLKKLFSRVRNIRQLGSRRDRKNEFAVLKKRSEKNYKEICGTLMERYMLSEFGFSVNDGDEGSGDGVGAGGYYSGSAGDEAGGCYSGSAGDEAGGCYSGSGGDEAVSYYSSSGGDDAGSGDGAGSSGDGDAFIKKLISQFEVWRILRENQDVCIRDNRLNPHLLKS